MIMDNFCIALFFMRNELTALHPSIHSSIHSSVYQSIHIHPFILYEDSHTAIRATCRRYN